jgi:putative membrane protein
MIIEFLLALFLGIIAGTLTGLTPGIHINLIASIIVSFFFNPSIANSNPLIIFIVSLAITHTFLDFIPSIFLGAPDEDTFLSVLPGHQMLKQGKAHEAVIITLYGSLTALIIIILFTPIFIFLIPAIFNISKLILPFILIFISSYILLREKIFITGFVVFFLSGFLGFATLNNPIKEPLLPLLSGLFGASSLILSINKKSSIGKQKIKNLKKIKISKKEFSKGFIGAIISAPLCSFLPGIGSGHAAIIGSEIIKQTNKGFLFLLGSINTIVMGLSFITLYTIQKTRTGAAAAVGNLTNSLSLQQLILILTTIIIAGTISFFIAIKVSKIFSKNINKLNYSNLSLIILVLLTIIVTLFTNILGLIVFITSASLGLFAILSGVRRINLMGSLLIPTILFYLF